MNIKLILFLLMELKLSQSMPQGFFSQGFAIPKLTLKNIEQSLTVAQVNIKSPSSLFGMFGNKNPVGNGEKSSTHEQLADNFEHSFVENKTDNTIHKLGNNSAVENNELKFSESDNKIPLVKNRTNVREDTDLFTTYNAIDENATENKTDDIDSTTVSFTETTTDDYETTTGEDVFNRASPQLVASLLG